MARSPKLEEWAGMGLGAWLLASPWVLGFSHQAAPTVNALLVGTILVLADSLSLIFDERSHRHRVHRRSGPGASSGHDVRDGEQEPLVGLS